MRQLTPHSRLVVATAPVDCHQGIAGLAAVCRHAWGATPLEGAVSVLRHRAGSALTRLRYDGQGDWLCMQRFSPGRVTWWPRSTDARVPLGARALCRLLWHGDPARAARAHEWRQGAEGEARLLAELQGSQAEGAAHTAWRLSCSAPKDAHAGTPAALQGASSVVRRRARSARGSVAYHRLLWR